MLTRTTLFGKKPLSYFPALSVNLNFVKTAIISSVILGISLVPATEVFAETTSIPGWVNDVISWHEKGLLTDNEIEQFVKYLDKKKVIDFSSSVFEDILQTNQSKYEIQITKGEKHIVPLDKIRSGGPPPDGIPSIDKPVFVKASEADFVSDTDLVIGVNYQGEIKAYPLFIMTWHEIVNDYFGDVPVAVTYCPLCFTNQV